MLELVAMQIKLGPPLFVPNGQIGSFGALSQFKSLVRNRTDLFDLAFSGPAAGCAVSAVLFIVGLVLSGSGLPKVRPQPIVGDLDALSLCTLYGPVHEGS